MSHNSWDNQADKIIQYHRPMKRLNKEPRPTRQKKKRNCHGILKRSTPAATKAKATQIIEGQKKK